MLQKIKVRFAPSPTGSLHLGGARTAIYNYLYARSNNGSFLLRIEDTDTKRSDMENVEQIYRSLKWLGLDWDEEPIFQSNRAEIYKKYIEQLLKQDKAYKCFCTPEEIEEERKSGAFQYSGKCRHLTKSEVDQKVSQNQNYVVRFKNPDKSIIFTDRVYGKISVKSHELDDFIIQRSDGSPTYQLAVVVDDFEMGITHVIRGEDHLSNTPKQINLYLALEKPIPKFAHLPLLLGADGKRLSKRHGATGVDEYKALGYPSAAVFNYLALLGWAPKKGQEILDKKSIIKQFSLNGIAKKSAVYDIKKLDWISDKHISVISNDEIFENLFPIFIKKGYITENHDNNRKKYIISAINLLKSRMKNYNQFFEWGDYFFKDPEVYDNNASSKYWNNQEVTENMTQLLNKFINIQSWNQMEIENLVRTTATELGCKAGYLIHPLRLAVTGQGVSPGIFEIVELIGMKTVLKRISKAIKIFPKE